MNDLIYTLQMAGVSEGFLIYLAISFLVMQVFVIIFLIDLISSRKRNKPRNKVFMVLAIIAGEIFSLSAAGLVLYIFYLLTVAIFVGI